MLAVPCPTIVLNSRLFVQANALDGSDYSVMVNTTHRAYDVHVVHPYMQQTGGGMKGCWIS